MSEQESTTPEAPEAATATDEVAPEATTTDTPDDTFDAARALEKIRKVNAEAKAMRDRAKAAEDKVATLEASATETAKLREQLMRAEVALELGLPATLAKRLQGDTPEAMKADAEELLAQVAPKSPPKSTRPVESLQPGSGKADIEGNRDQQIAAARRSGDWRTAMSLENSKLADLRPS